MGLPTSSFLSSLMVPILAAANAGVETLPESLASGVYTSLNLEATLASKEEISEEIQRLTTEVARLQREIEILREYLPDEEEHVSETTRIYSEDDPNISRESVGGDLAVMDTMLWFEGASLGGMCWEDDGSDTNTCMDWDILYGYDINLNDPLSLDGDSSNATEESSVTSDGGDRELGVEVPSLFDWMCTMIVVALFAHTFLNGGDAEEGLSPPEDSTTSSAETVLVTLAPILWIVMTGVGCLGVAARSRFYADHLPPHLQKVLAVYYGLVALSQVWHAFWFFVFPGSGGGMEVLGATGFFWLYATLPFFENDLVRYGSSILSTVQSICTEIHSASCAKDSVVVSKMQVTSTPSEEDTLVKKLLPSKSTEKEDDALLKERLVRKAPKLEAMRIAKAELLLQNSLLHKEDSAFRRRLEKKAGLEAMRIAEAELLLKKSLSQKEDTVLRKRLEKKAGKLQAQRIASAELLLKNSVHKHKDARATVVAEATTIQSPLAGKQDGNSPGMSPTDCSSSERSTPPLSPSSKTEEKEKSLPGNGNPPMFVFTPAETAQRKEAATSSQEPKPQTKAEVDPPMFVFSSRAPTSRKPQQAPKAISKKRPKDATKVAEKAAATKPKEADPATFAFSSRASRPTRQSSKGKSKKEGTQTTGQAAATAQLKQPPTKGDMSTTVNEGTSMTAQLKQPPTKGDMSKTELAAATAQSKIPTRADLSMTEQAAATVESKPQPTRADVSLFATKSAGKARKDSTYTGPVDLDESIADSSSSDAYRGPVDVDAFMDSSGSEDKAPQPSGLDVTADMNRSDDDVPTTESPTTEASTNSAKAERDPPMFAFSSRAPTTSSKPHPVTKTISIEPPKEAMKSAGKAAAMKPKELAVADPPTFAFSSRAPRPTRQWSKDEPKQSVDEGRSTSGQQVTKAKKQPKEATKSAGKATIDKATKPKEAAVADPPTFAFSSRAPRPTRQTSNDKPNHRKEGASSVAPAAATAQSKQQPAKADAPLFALSSRAPGKNSKTHQVEPMKETDQTTWKAKISTQEGADFVLSFRNRHQLEKAVESLTCGKSVDGVRYRGQVGTVRVGGNMVALTFVPAGKDSPLLSLDRNSIAKVVRNKRSDQALPKAKITTRGGDDHVLCFSSYQDLETTAKGLTKLQSFNGVVYKGLEGSLLVGGSSVKFALKGQDQDDPLISIPRSAVAKVVCNKKKD